MRFPGLFPAAVAVLLVAGVVLETVPPWPETRALVLLVAGVALVAAVLELRLAAAARRRERLLRDARELGHHGMYHVARGETYSECRFCQVPDEPKQ